MIIDKNEIKRSNREKFITVDQILNEEYKRNPSAIGTCHKYWARKKQLLKDMYDIDWMSPAELNPGIIFD